MLSVVLYTETSRTDASSNVRSYSATATVEADLDVRRFRDGIDEERAGFRSVRATVTVETDASDGDVAAWLEDVRDRNPVIDNLLAPTLVDIETEIKSERD